MNRRDLLRLAACGLIATPRGAQQRILSNPFAGKRLYVDPASQAAEWVRVNERTRPADASVIRRIAREPMAIWSGRWKDDPAAGIRTVLDRAAGSLCVFVAYNIPNRDLGQYSAGGARDGFSLNVSNFIETSRCLQYGRDILDALRSHGIADKGFVIDTGRNGAGPFRGGPEAWCNPPGRALGDPPREGPAPADALLWIKPPGDSDGTCRQGPHAGRFWPEYALDLVRARPR